MQFKSDFERKHIISQIFAKNTMPFAKENDIAFLLDAAEHILKRKGSFIYLENDEPDSFYLILSGKVELSKHSPDGQKHIQAYLKEGNIFGIPELFCPRQIVTAQCHSDCELARYSRATFMDTLSHNRILMLEFLEIASRTIETLQNSAMIESLEEKIENYLAWMIIKCGISEGNAVRVPRKHTHEKIAEMLRVSRERVTKMLNAMKAEDRIFIDDTNIIIHDKKIIERSRNYNFSHLGLYGSED